MVVIWASKETTAKILGRKSALSRTNSRIVIRRFLPKAERQLQNLSKVVARLSDQRLPQHLGSTGRHYSEAKSYSEAVQRGESNARNSTSQRRSDSQSGQQQHDGRRESANDRRSWKGFRPRRSENKY